MQHRPIALVGPTGSGKTTAGMALATALQWPFVDLDQRIESMQACTIADLFASAGETGFRLAEQDALVAVTQEANRSPCVCATGGGIVETAHCRTILRTHWFVVALDAEMDTLMGRLSGQISHRPMLASETDLSTRLAVLLERRLPLYKETSHMKLAVDGRSIQEIVRALRQQLQGAGVIDGNRG